MALFGSLFGGPQTPQGWMTGLLGDLIGLPTDLGLIGKMQNAGTTGGNGGAGQTTLGQMLAPNGQNAGVSTVGEPGGWGPMSSGLSTGLGLGMGLGRTGLGLLGMSLGPYGLALSTPTIASRIASYFGVPSFTNPLASIPTLSEIAVMRDIDPNRAAQMASQRDAAISAMHDISMQNPELSYSGWFGGTTDPSRSGGFADANSGESNASTGDRGGSYGGGGMGVD